MSLLRAILLLHVILQKALLVREVKLAFYLETILVWQRPFHGAIHPRKRSRADANNLHFDPIVEQHLNIIQ